MTTRRRQRTVFCRIGRELMQGNCNRLSRTRLQHYGRSVNSHTPLCLAAVRRKLLRGQTMKLGSRPAGFHEQPMDLCERSNTPLDQLLEIIRGTGARETHCRQHGGQDVLCSMLGLAREIDDLRLAAFALRDVLEAVDGADNVSPLSLIASMSTSAMPREPSGRSMWTSCARTKMPVRSTSAMGH